MHAWLNKANYILCLYWASVSIKCPQWALWITLSMVSWHIDVLKFLSTFTEPPAPLENGLQNVCRICCWKLLLLNVPPSQIWTASSSTESWMDGTSRIAQPPLIYFAHLYSLWKSDFKVGYVSDFWKCETPLKELLSSRAACISTHV